MLKRLRPSQRQAALITLTNHFTGAGFLKIKSLPKVTPKLLKQLAPVDVFLTVFDVSGKTCRPSEAINLTDRTFALPRGAEHAVRVRYSHLAALPL